MIKCNDAINKVVGILKSDETLSDIDFFSEFPSKRRDIPLRKVTVSVGVEALKLLPAMDASVIATGTANERLIIKLTVCAPRNLDGSECYDALDRIIVSLKSLCSSYSVISIETGQIKYSSSINGLCIPVSVTVMKENTY